MARVAEKSAARARSPRFVRRVDFVLVAIVILAVVLRLWGLGRQSFWYDEWLTTEATSGGLADALRHAANREGIPPTYFALLWGWVRVFGDGEVALRSVSALFGAATVPVAYSAARELGGRRTVARSAALLVAVNPMLVWYSQEARPYGLLALLGALSLFAFARAWRRGRRSDYLLWGLVSAAAVAVHYFAIFLVVAEAAALFLLRREQARRLVLAGVPVVLVGVVLTPFALKQYSHEPNRRWISEFSLTDRASEAGHSGLVGPSPPDGRLWLVAAIVVAIAALLVISRGSRQERSAAGLTAGIGGAAVLIPLVAVVVGLDVFLSRYLIAALVPLVIAVAIALCVRRASWIGGIGLAVLCAVSVGTVVAVARDPELQKPDWGSVAEAFETGHRNRILVLNAHGNLASPLFRYAPDSRPLGDTDTVTADEIDLLAAKPTTKPCNFLVGQACAFIFLGGPLPPHLASTFTLKDTRDLNQFTLRRYRADRPVPLTKPELVSPQNPTDALTLVSR